MSNTPVWAIPYVPENTTDPAAGLNLSLFRIDEALSEVQLTGMTNPMTAASDLIVGGVDGAPERLPKGGGLQVLRMNAAGDGLEYSDPAGGALVNPMTAPGDLIVGGAGGVPARQAIGTALQVLRVNAAGNALEYATPAAAGAIFAPTVTESTTSRTLGLTGAGAYIRFTNAAASTCTVPPQASVAWAADTEINIRRAAAGSLTLTAGAGVTLNPPAGGTLVMTSAMSATLKRVAANVWDVIGQTVPA
tara:strand:- start:993 stop:1736 length:744 start_codon:yes stop_codon:yes gene_type:complete